MPSVNALRPARIEPTKRVPAINSHRGEGFVLSLQVEEVKIGNGPQFEILLTLENYHQLIGLWIWQRIKQYTIDHGKDGDVDTDTQRQRHYYDERENGILPQYSQAELQISKHLAFRMPFWATE